MKLLALDTSTEVAGVALLEGAQIRFSHTFLHRMDLSRRLLPAVRWLLGDAGVPFASVEGLVVGLGPGSFTGVRIGVTTAKVLAQAVNLPLVGIGTLETMAAALLPCAGRLVCPCIDARKSEVYTALYRLTPDGCEELMPPAALPADLLAARLDELDEEVIVCGTGSVRYAPTLAAVLGERLRRAPGHDFPDPAVLAHLGRRRLERGEREDPLRLTPIYARVSEAERSLATCG